MPELRTREAVRGDADDGELPPVDHDRLAEHIHRAAKALLPQPVPENRGRLGAGTIIGGLQDASRRGERAERREIRSGDEVAADPLRLAAAPQAERRGAKGDDARQDPARTLTVVEVPGYDMPPGRGRSRKAPEIHTSSEGEATPGIALKRAAFASVKIVLLTPIPSASVAIAPKLKTGLRDSDRTANLTS